MDKIECYILYLDKGGRYTCRDVTNPDRRFTLTHMYAAFVAGQPPENMKALRRVSLAVYKLRLLIELGRINPPRVEARPLPADAPKYAHDAYVGFLLLLRCRQAYSGEAGSAPYTSEQARAFLDAVRGDRLEALYTLALALGLRRGEMLGLRWEEVDLDRGTLTARASLQRVDGKLKLLDVKTDQSQRTLRLPKIVISSLRAHKLRQIEARLVAGPRWMDTGYVFTSTIGAPLEPRRLARMFEQPLSAAGLPRIRVHDLRHSAATLLMAQGVPIKMVSELLGHSTTRMTLDVYTHVLDSMRQEAADRMDDLLSGAG